MEVILLAQIVKAFAAEQGSREGPEFPDNLGENAAFLV